MSTQASGKPFQWSTAYYVLIENVKPTGFLQLFEVQHHNQLALQGLAGQARASKLFFKTQPLKKP